MEWIKWFRNFLWYVLAIIGLLEEKYSISHTSGKRWLNFLLEPPGQEVELTMHDGTVRDLCFLEDTSNKSSLLISGGAGDCKIYVTDCATGTPFQALSGHSGHVLTLYNWGGAMFVSGSQDKTVRFWDLRTRGCVNMVTPATVPGSRVSWLLRRYVSVNFLVSFSLMVTPIVPSSDGTQNQHHSLPENQ